MNEVIDEARRAKGRAMGARDRGNYAEAVTILDETEQLLSRELAELKSKRSVAVEPGSTERDIANQLVHIRGTKGGVLRRWGKYEESAKAYDAGYEFEQPNSNYGIVNSYTLTQRLVARAFIAPDSVLDEQQIVLELPVRRELRKAGLVIQRQIKGPRESDPYAKADLATVFLLLGDKAWDSMPSNLLDSASDPYSTKLNQEALADLRKQDWKGALKDFKGAGSDAYAIRVTREVFEDLCKVAETTTPVPRSLKERLLWACDYL